MMVNPIRVGGANFMVVKPRRIGRAKHAANWRETGTAYKMLVGKPLAKRPLW
jgi:hypothetical protein